MNSSNSFFKTPDLSILQRNRIPGLLFSLFLLLNISSVWSQPNYPQITISGGELGGAGTTKDLVDLCLASNGSCSKTEFNPRIIVKMDLGDNYDFGSTAWTAGIQVSLSAYEECPGTSTFVGTISTGFTLDENTPEKVWIIDVDDALAGAHTFRFTVSGGGSDALINAVLRLTATFNYNLELVPLSAPTISSPAAAGSSDSRMTFSWTAPCPEISNYQFQLLRLYNYDDANQTETTIDAVVDWDRALTLETFSSATSLTITMAEERGYYLWRVRAIGNVGPWGENSPENHGPWSGHGSFSSGAFHITGAAGNYLFFYDGFDNDKNWIYGRTFTEGNTQNDEQIRIGENIKYANNLQNIKQEQVRSAGKDQVLVNQTVYDYTGRPAIKSIPVPVNGKNDFAYQDTLMKHNGDLYTPEHFDEDDNFRLPEDVDDASVNDNYYYFSDNNAADPDVPTAEGFPYSRTLFYEDATSRVLEQGGVGYTHRVDTLQLSQTTKTFYNTVANDELIRVFGDEAPIGSSVYKKITIDVNQVASLEYVDEDGRVMASALTINGRNLYKNDEDSMRGTMRGTPTELDAVFEVLDTMDYRIIAPYTKFSDKSIAIIEREGKWVGLNYELHPGEIEDLCSEYCQTCDYYLEVTVFAHDDTVHVPFFYYDTLIPPDICVTNDSVEWDTLLYFPKGRYTISKRVRSHNTIPGSSFPEQLYLDSHITALGELYEDLYETDVKPYIDLIMAGKLNKLYDTLGIDTTADPTSLEALDGTTRKILFGCDSLEIPIRICVPYSCPASDFEFYERFLDFNTAPSADGSGRLDIFNYHYTGGEFNQMVYNMIDDGYDCDSLWGCWENLVQNFDLIKSGYTAVGMAPLDLSLLFLDCVGYRIVDGTDDPEAKYGDPGGMLSPNSNPHPGYYSHAYAYFFYEGGSSLPCEALFGGSPFMLGFDAGSNPWPDSIWFRFKKCVESYPIASGLSYPNITDLQAEMQDSCETHCDRRRYSFISAIVDEFHKDSIYVENDKYYLAWDSTIGRYIPFGTPLPALFDWQVCWSEVECLADILVNRCKEDCDISIQYDGDTPVGIGDSLEIANFSKALAANFSLDIPVGGNCPGGFEKLSYTNCSHIQPGGVIPGPIVSLISTLNSIVMGGEADTLLPGSMPGDLVYKVFSNCDSFPDTVGVIIDSTGIKFAIFDGSGNYIGVFNSCSYPYADFLNSGAGFTYNPNTHYIEIHLPGGIIVPITCIEWCNMSCEEIYTEIAEEIVEILQTSGQGFIDLYRIGGGGYSFKIGGECYPASNVNYAIMVDRDSIRLVYYQNPDETGEEYAVLCSEFIYEWNEGEGDGMVVYDPTLGRLISISTSRMDSTLIDCFELCCDDEMDPSTGGGINGDCSGYKEICFKWDTLEANPWDTIPFAFAPLTCEEIVLNYIGDQLNFQVYEYIEHKKDSLRLAYANNCTNPNNLKDYFWLSYPEGIHHYTLYYYDRAGNLMKTVPPKGVDQLELDDPGVRGRQVAPDHTHVTDYEYNSLGQLIRQHTPDGGQTLLYYDSKRQLRFTQNAKQLLDSTFSYTKYDELGRVVEVGQSTWVYPLDSIDLLNNPNYPGSGNEQITGTVYSLPYSGLSYLGQGNLFQRFLQNRVSYAFRDEDGDTTTKHDLVITYYSYDPHGNVEWMVQELPYFGRKYISYEYDLVSGKVLQVSYQEGFVDQFYHRYGYDADNRVIKVETSIDGVIWDVDATYDYWLHGPLKRIEIGEDKVQGLDHAYTIQGWLKGINHPALDITKDPAEDGDGSSEFGRDAFGMILNYYDDDFERSASYYGNGQTDALAAGQYRNLYNGNISSWVSNSFDHQYYFYPDPDSVGLSGNMTGRKFKYDVLNRLLWSDFKDYDAGWTDKNQYLSRYEYDPNGNFTVLKRNSYLDMEHTEYIMDSMLYIYEEGNNRLKRVIDSADHYFDFRGPHAYTYDATGNLVKDSTSAMETLDSIYWTVYGKVGEVIKKPIYSDIKFMYDAFDNRVIKEVKHKYHGPFFNMKDESEWDVYYYVRDAQGNIMAMYNRIDSVRYTDTTVLRKYILEEQPIYGSKRIGLRKGNGLVADTLRLELEEDSLEYTYYYIKSVINSPVNLVVNDTDVFARNIGLKQYELTDHLGNVRVVVSDIKESTWGSSVPPADFEPDILAMNDYNPFGSTMLSRTYNSPDYRYGFNGMEKDDEIKGESNSIDFGARMYDPRLGKFLSIDPDDKKYPAWSPYLFSANNPLRYVDVEGLGPGDVVVVFAGAWIGEPIGRDGLSDTNVPELIKNVESKEAVPGGAFKGFASKYWGVDLDNPSDLDVATDAAYAFIKANHCKGGKVVLYGFSWGGNHAQHLANRLKADNIKVDLLITVDQAGGPENHKVIRQVSSNVKKNVNIYQTNPEAFTGSCGGANCPEDSEKTEVVNSDYTDTYTGQPGEKDYEETQHGNIHEKAQQRVEGEIVETINEGDE